jgi:probable F420-dependent oxidoreductase
MTKNFRFGIILFSKGTRSVWQDIARRVEDLGYDVLTVPDHVTMCAPFPALMSAAAVTTRPRLGTMVLATGLYNPALLARDVAQVHELTDGRFELGLGTGWMAEDFQAAGLPFPSRAKRAEGLEHTTTEVTRMLREAGHQVPVLIGAGGDRMLTLAAKHADIVSIQDAPGITPRGEPGHDTLPHGLLAGRIGFLRQAAGDRFDQIELCLVLCSVHIAGSGEPDLGMARALYPGLSDEELLRLPGVQHGSEQDIADSLRQLRDTQGITYFAVMEYGGNLEAFGKVISQFR